MANIFVNGLKSKTGGGKSILNNYLSLLKESKSKNHFIVLTPDRTEYEKYHCEGIEIIDIKALYKKNILAPIVNHFLLPKLLRNLHVDLLFNMGDIVIPTNTPQFYLFDWPYAIYPESVVWHRMDFSSYLSRRIKLFFFKLYITRATSVLAQTETAKARLEQIYCLKNIEIVPNAVSLENMDGGTSVDFNLPKNKIKLLYLTYYYPHKNLEVFLPLAKKIKSLALSYCLVITIEPSQHHKAAHFLKAVKKENLDDVIINIGPVKMSNVPSLYAQCDALLMPTILESFSGTYVEAMYHKKTILTSDLDFARDVCGEAAFYFEPFNVDSILAAIKLAFENYDVKNKKILEGKNKLACLLSWEQAFKKYQDLMEKTLTRI
jgi:glycosyltransferase involved in cell wall biosynthesis